MSATISFCYYTPLFQQVEDVIRSFIWVKVSRTHYKKSDCIRNKKSWSKSTDVLSTKCTSSSCLKVWEMTMDFRRSPYTMLNSTVSAMEAFRFLESIICQYRTLVGVQHDPVLHCNHPVCSLHTHLGVVWISHQTGQEQMTTDDTTLRQKN